MLLSVADGRPRNTETIRTPDLIPSALRSNAQSFLALLEQYYDFINTEGLPTDEIASITSQKDIDRVSLKYLDQIEEYIGKNIPKSRAMNRVEVYRMIVKYYNSRGSDDSVHAFFKIFFGVLIELFYPGDYLFDLSNGRGYWPGNEEIRKRNQDPILRNSDSAKSSITIQGMTYTDLLGGGAAQLTSVEYRPIVNDSYSFECLYDNGLTTVIAGDKSHITITLDNAEGLSIATDYYFLDFFNGKPRYSAKLNFTSSAFHPSIYWDGYRWIYRLMQEYYIYSDDAVDDPVLVTNWSPVIDYITFNGYLLVYDGTPLALSSEYSALSVSDISFVAPITAQIHSGLKRISDFNKEVSLSITIGGSAWFSAITSHSREYMTNGDALLPAQIETGQLALVNCVNESFIHPYVLGISDMLFDHIVWKRLDILDEWTYENDKSRASHKYKIFDGVFWQNYSYNIRSELDIGEWYDDYMKFVHPAGLKLFNTIIIEAVLHNDWSQRLNYLTSDQDDRYRWLRALVPPHALNPRSIGYHSPKYQPGWLKEMLYRYLFTYYSDNEELLRVLILTFKLMFTADARNSFVREQYQASEKFIDSVMIGDGYFNMTIADAEESYNETNKCRFLNIASFIDGNIDWNEGSIDINETSDELDWQDSTISNSLNNDTFDSSYVQVLE
jgi:hypothetical protein